MSARTIARIVRVDCFLAVHDQRPALGDRLRGEARRCEADRQWLDRRPELVDGLKQSAVDRRDHQTAFAGLLDEPLGLQGGKCMHDRLSRHVKALRNLLLGQPLPRRECAIANGVENNGICLFHKSS